MRVLNLYAGAGGNRKLWGDISVTAVEYDQEIAKIYETFYPNDEIIVCDAHDYLAKNYQQYDFIWSSPPCQTHSRVRMMASKAGSYDAVMPNMNLYSEIIFLSHYAKCKWAVENVIPYYTPLIQPTVQLVRHYIWSNFDIPYMEFEKPNIKHNKVTSRTERYGISVGEFKTKQRRDQIIRNCVDPQLGLYVLECAFSNRNLGHINNDYW